ncbi:hypothetical protein N7489_004617 [Penicillium chrysogenum]|uniref:uncharacterized protein n=1 Tax=Penicillium chrysogenum TaxID=5076 RepID=UPI0024DF18FE|nr:uncharacterized protein N7489_004617 [Penicillium chrysogenum]KAJ5244521.1 hypothetical protein N7489_004617 [Penicillium chrysogenum]KAJ5852982.1 hypothetical protein N7534_005525 [Penicillium rubens]
MSVSDRDLHFRPILRSPEENQERAFIAASRRKDQSLDARVKSANRASSLHKRRTGKAFHITKEIVEEEGMYEEVDERYQAKRILMLQNQTLRMKEQFYRHLLAGFQAVQNFTRKDPPLQKLSLDLSSINSSFSLGVAALASTTASADSHVPSPNTSFDPKMQPYIPCTCDSKIPVTISATPFFCDDLPEDAQLRGTNICTSLEYRGHPTSAGPCLGPTLTDIRSVKKRQRQVMHQARAPIHPAAQLLQSRECLASAPELPLQHPAPPQR